MKRRSLVALVAAGVLVFLGLIVVSGVLFVTRSSQGREWLRTSIAQPLVTRALKGRGTIYLGHFSGNFLSQLTIDSVAIRDAHGELVASSGPVTLDYNPRDLIDYRIFFRRATIEHPYLHFVQYGDYTWNFKKLFESGPETKKPNEVSTRGWGNYFVVDSARIHDGTFLLTLPWHPDDSLKGARRDSVIRVTLATPSRAVSQTIDGFGRLYAWRNLNALIAHSRLADPDSDDKFGREFKIATLSADEFEPTFKFRNLVGDVRVLGDSCWFQSPHFEMPASTARGAGKVWWGSDLPVRYDILVHGTSVSLADVNWVYPPLPTTGGGSLDLAIRNDPKNLQVVDFQLTNMDVQTTGSHLLGTMWFGIGAPVLLVRNVEVRADPIDFDFIRYINLPKPFPVDWRGQLFGTVKGRGGPLTHFVVDQSDVTFRDAHVPGAVSKAAGKGELDILNPAFTAFHAFDVNASSVDLRSIEYLFPSFPRLHGFLSGTATLDSSWLDVRFSNASVFHQDGAGDPSHITGSGRITNDEPFMTYDVTLDARPLSLTMLSRSYPNPLRGLVSGPIKAEGQSPDLSLSTSLTGEAGTFSFDGRVDLDTVGGYGARGKGQFSALSPSTLLAKSAGPRGVFSGHYDVDVTGETAATLHGNARVAIERTTFDSVTIYPSLARVTFGGGVGRVDSLLLETSAGTVEARGAIGLPKGSADSLSFSYDLDSLGGLRHFLGSSDSTAAADSLAGSLKVRGVLYGRLDSLRVAGELEGSRVYVRKDASDTLIVGFDFANVTDSASGRVVVGAAKATLGGIALDTLGGTFSVNDGSHGDFRLGALSRNGPLVISGGTWSAFKNAWSVGLTSLDLVIGKDEWQLGGPAHFEHDTLGTRLDSLVLKNRDSAVVAMGGDVPDSGNVSGRLRAINLPLGDVSVLEQLVDSIAGLGRLDATIAGTRDHPVLSADATITSLLRNGVTLDRVALNAQFHDRDADLKASVTRKGATALTARANVPIDFKFFSIKPRNDSISGEIHVPPTDLSIVQLASRSLSQVSGTLRGDIKISGTPSSPVFDTGKDGLRIANASAQLPQLGIALADINCNVSGSGDLPSGDSLSVSDCRATTAGQKAADRGTIKVDAWTKDLARFFLTKPDPARPAPSPSFRVAIGLSNFHAFNKRSVADVFMTTPNPQDSIRIVGDLKAARLTGAVQVDRSKIFLPDRDLARKQLDQNPLDITNDTVGGRAGLATLKTNLTIPDFTVTLGTDVRLTSKEADVRLGGSLNVVNSTARASRLLASTNQLIPLIGLEGTLRTIGGSYTLDLGLAQRQFDVLPDGSVTFTGDAENPTLDINAQYNVKQYRDRDLGVIVNLRGPLNPYPEITFTSNADYAISQSDLVSYLVTGAPGFELNNQKSEVLAQFIGPTVSAVTANSLRQLVGPWVDAFRFELGTASTSGQTQSNTLNYLYGATVGVEKQLTDRMFLSLNTGLCQLDPNTQGANLLAGFGAKVEYRFKPELSTQLAMDPSTAARTCSPGQGIIGIVPTPRQFSFSLHHTFRF
jgi:translocation and assembly module TamB